jgi:hypothetical protein
MPGACRALLRVKLNALKEGAQIASRRLFT